MAFVVHDIPPYNGHDLSWRSSAEPFDIVAIAASAGGLRALQFVLQGLPVDFGATVLVAQHLPARNTYLVDLLRPYSRIPVKYAEDREPILRGRVFVAPAGCHLRVRPSGLLSVSDGERFRFVRPSA